MTHFLHSLSKDQKVDFSILVVISLLLTTVALLSSLLIPVIEDSNRIYVPTTIDYFRTLILSFIASLILNYSYRNLSKFTIVFKIWIQFLSILLLALPQQTSISKTYSNWNLVKREAYVFGVFYQLGSLLFYLYDQLEFLTDDENKRQLLSNEVENEINHMNETVRQKSTLENCIQIRRNSSNLRKILYAQNYKYHDYKTSKTTSDTPPEEINEEPIIRDFDVTLAETSNLLAGTNQGIRPSRSYGSIVSSVVSLKPTSAIPARIKWLLDHTIWITSSFLYEIGISLILSITFIYVPGVKDHFSKLEFYYYNHIGLFVAEVATPLFIITMGVQYLIYKVTMHFHDDKSLIAEVISAYWIYVALSVLLFGFSFIL